MAITRDSITDIRGPRTPTLAAHWPVHGRLEPRTLLCGTDSKDCDERKR